MSDTSLIIARMKVLSERFTPSDNAIDNALLRIAMMVIAKAKINVRRHRMVDTGRLINSLRWEFYRNSDSKGVYIGSFGIKYAAMNEFGGEVSERQRRAMFKALSMRGGPRLPSKNVIQKSGSQWYWKPRPYLRKALIESKGFITETIREMMRVK
jgi:phage gpG-like protein